MPNPHDGPSRNRYGFHSALSAPVDKDDKDKEGVSSLYVHEEICDPVGDLLGKAGKANSLKQDGDEDYKLAVKVLGILNSKVNKTIGVNTPQQPEPVIKKEVDAHNSNDSSKNSP